jgi:hypothetical protein
LVRLFDYVDAGNCVWVRIASFVTVCVIKGGSSDSPFFMQVIFAGFISFRPGISVSLLLGCAPGDAVPVDVEFF